MANLQSRIIVIDGSNLARSSSWRHRHHGLADELLHQRLVDAISSWAAGVGCPVELVFDGVQRAPGTTAGPVQIRYASSEGAASADELIERRILEMSAAGWSCDVVSDDHGVRSVVGAAVDRVLTCAAFVRELEDDDPVHHMASEPDMNPAGAGRSRLVDHMDPATRAALERIRRNQ